MTVFRRLNSSFWLGLVLLAGTFLVYQPAWQAGFIWDDDDYVTHNPLLSARDGLRRIWFTLDSPSQYFPLTYTVFRIQYALWGLHPGPYHWVNLFLHGINALLVWRLLTRLRVPGAWFAAAIFAWHPVQVESVAWISELKNVLSCLFFLTALLAWQRFTDEARAGRAFFYILALLSHALALLSKTTACTLPLILLLLLWFERKPINSKRLLQVAPFAVLSLGMGLLTIWWERFHQGTRGTDFFLSAGERGLVASQALWFYLGKLLWPAALSFSYPKWAVDAASPAAYAWTAAVFAAALGLYSTRRYFGRTLITASLFFVVSLSPLLGFVMLYTFRYSFVADHYQYVACMGPIALAGAGMSLAVRRWRGHWTWAGPVLCGALLVALGTLTWRQSRMYAGPEMLWRTTLSRNPGSWLAHNNLGLLCFESGRAGEAVEHYTAALKLNPSYMEAHNNLGAAFLKQGRVDEAIPHFKIAAELFPRSAEPEYNLGKAMADLGKFDDAVAAYGAALRVSPMHPLANYNLAGILVQRGQLREAVSCYEKALLAQPDFPDAAGNLGTVLLQLGQTDAALKAYEKALARRPDDPVINFNLGNIRLQQGRVEQARAHYERVLNASPQHAGAHLNLGATLVMARQFEEAVPHFRAGLKLRPDDAGGHYNLGLVLVQLGRREEGILEFKETLRLNPEHAGAREQVRRLQAE